MVGKVFNQRYELVEQVGQGGMAVTYRGRDLLLGRSVAVKVLRPQFSNDPQFVERFRREARAAASLSHEFIADVYDTGSDGRDHYIVNEFVEGEDLRHYLQAQGTLPPSEAALIAARVARALGAAHENGIVHRDVKPHNILLTRDGVKVTDFGIAKAIAAPSETDTGLIIGSVHYFSPEQARGERVGPRADLYSLGIVLFEMLTGQRPFEGEHPVAVAHQQIYQPPPSLRSLKPGIPWEIEAMVHRLLQKDPAKRYPSAEALAADLEAFAAGRPVSIVLEPALGPRARKKAWRAPAIAAIVVAVVAGGAAATLTLRGRTGGSIEVPDLYAVDRESARRILESLGLRYSEAGSRPSDLLVDLVVDQEPKPSKRVSGGTDVRLWLSSGQRRVEVPNVSDMSLAAARRELEAAQLQTGEITERESDSVPKGYVVRSEPAARQRTEKGSRVALIVSKGPPKPVITEEIDPFAAREPTPVTRKEEFKFTVPPQPTTGDVMVRIDVEDLNGTRTIYEAPLPPGAKLPTLKIERTGTATVRAYVSGEVVLSKEFGER